MIPLCEVVNSNNSVNVAVLSPFTNYQATGSNTLPWTPETQAIDLLMRNVERIGGARHDWRRWITGFVVCLQSLSTTNLQINS